jgi:drug/metabolite transporter (DMT)-like permease
MERTSRGILFIILSALGFAVMNFFVKLSGDLPFAEKVMFRNFVSLFVALLLLLKEKPSMPKQKGDWWLLLLRSVLGTGGIYGNFYAIDHLLLSDASMLNKLSPFFTLLFSFCFLKERIKPVQVLCIVGAFLGSLFIIKPTGFQNASFFPALVGFIGGMCAGGAYTCVRALGNRSVPGPVIIFVFSLFTTVVTLPLFVATVVPVTGKQVVCLLMTGVGATVGQFCITAAYKYAPAREISIYDYTNVLFSALLGFLFLGQKPDVLSVIGYLVIFAMALLMFQYNRKRAS